jgi:hypothetical protein
MFNGDRNDNKEYIGLALGELYKLNPDYLRINKEKIFYHLPLEYDCCSECQENFPHRIHYSEQSFQEELSDNYRIFLPNNYKDIQGETGEITNLFKIGNDLFIHTLEGLWQMPRNYQERVTDQVVSFIGTGSYFEIPPQKILDDDTGLSAGLQHKWSAIKTPSGYFFVSENQKAIYQFNGKKLNPISSVGLSNWFKENLESKLDKDYNIRNNKIYPYKDNPSNPFGTGFISTYDSKKERLIFTKKDRNFTQNIVGNTGYEIAVCNGQVIVFYDFQATIDNYENLGYKYLGIKDCQMVFSIEVIEEVQVVEYVWVPPVIETHFVTYFKGFWEEDDPAHPNGGTVTYIIYPGGIESTIDNIWNNDCIGLPNQGIVSYHGCAPGCEPQETIEVIITPGYYEQIIKVVEQPVTEYLYIDGTPLEDKNSINNSWTISYSLKSNSWISWHSYIPNFYINIPEKFYSWKFGNNGIWKHNNKTNYQTFYGEQYPYILEYVSTSSPTTMITNHIRFNTEAKKYDFSTQEYNEERYITFNKAIIYNSRQCSGLIDLIVKDTQSNQQDYLLHQIQNNGNNNFIIDRNETDWTLNDLRDIRIDYTKPIWNSNINSLQSEYYIDKKLNAITMDVNKDWTQLESFRDKYLVVRLIFDNFADIKLLTNYSIENEQESYR